MGEREREGEGRRERRREKDSKGKERQCCLLAPWDKFSEKVQKLNTEIIHKIKKYRQHHLSRKKRMIEEEKPIKQTHSVDKLTRCVSNTLKRKHVSTTKYCINIAIQTQ